MCLTAKNFGLQEENINISKPQGKTTENGLEYHRRKRVGVPQKEKRDRCTERERGRENAVIYGKGG